MELHLTRKGQGRLLWWLVSVGMLAAIFIPLVYIGVNMFSMQTNTHGLQNEILFERALNLVYSPDPLTGLRVAPGKISGEQLARLFKPDKDIGLRVDWAGIFYFPDEDKYNLTIEREFVKYDHRAKIKYFDGKKFETGVSIEK